MEYGIHPFGKIDGAFGWRYDDLDEAKAQAQKLAEEHRVEILVFQVVGSFKPTTTWVEN